jgi:hypothetical protein
MADGVDFTIKIGCLAAPGSSLETLGWLLLSVQDFLYLI